MIDIYSIDYKKFLQELPQPFNLSSLHEYLNGGRQDVLDNTDIFFENVRSKDLREKKFDLFKKSDKIDKNTVIVFPFYLELFEYFGQFKNIQYSIKTIAERFPNNKIIFFWNHDTDFAKYNKTVKPYSNVKIINYNTSQKTSNDIIVPFWSMGDIEPLKNKKEIFCSFIGSVNNNLRNQVALNLCGPNKFFYINNLNSAEFRNFLSKTTFSLCPKGVGLSSYRFFECFHANSIPVLIADDIILPYEEIIDYNKLIIRIPESKVSDYEYIIKILNSINSEEMLENITKYREYFTLSGIQEYVYNNLK